MITNKKIDLIILVIYPLFGAAISFLLNVNFFISVLIFFILPSIYLTFRAPRFFKRVAIFSVLIGLPFMIIIDYIAHLNHQWFLNKSIFPRLFEYASIEVILWAIFNLYFVVMFYEYFIHRYSTKIILYKKLKYLFLFSLFLFLIFLVFYTYYPYLLNIDYFYLRYGIVGIALPIIFQLVKYPKFFLKFIKVAIYFFYVTLLYEFTGLKIGWWYFPESNFIGQISIFAIKFPVEEFVFWILLFAMAVLSFYEYFDSEEK